MTSSGTVPPEGRWCGTALLPGGTGSLKEQRGAQSEEGLMEEAHRRTREVKEENEGGSTFPRKGRIFAPPQSHFLGLLPLLLKC